ncbi:WhiB family transcriptional regulator [Streptomyces bathyalis]|uniref:Transcriptional regulator WhiB n=1 Tax=Streptomyces bathyalis TaxID=2710756 RepID=A0A7T1T2D1_9ACTN|nr:WhiB family transcriptional regulator [Streptomyces bathyalis]QPP05136.1 WhiB family transcriptional regulator [Streptomyces bathyalis]
MRYITTNEARPTGLRGIADHSWHDRALCSGMDPAEADELFFPRPRDICAIKEAKHICSRCPVRRACFNAALDTESKEGIWAGLTEDERRPWHEKIAHRLDYARVRAVFHGRDIHLSSAERSAVARHAYTCGWRPERLAALLRVDYSWARDLLLAARHEVANRDRYFTEHPDTKKGSGATSGPAKKTKTDEDEETQPPLHHQEHTQELLDALDEAA